MKKTFMLLVLGAVLLSSAPKAHAAVPGPNGGTVATDFALGIGAFMSVGASAITLLLSHFGPYTGAYN